MGKLLADLKAHPDIIMTVQSQLGQLVLRCLEDKSSTELAEDLIQAGFVPNRFV